jgi:hypothetical protein
VKKQRKLARLSATARRVDEEHNLVSGPPDQFEDRAVVNRRDRRRAAALQRKKK